MRLLVTQLRLEADGVVSVTLRDPSGARLPGWAPGAHIAVTLGSGLVRQYSLCGPPEDAYCYTVAVLLADSGRGGSREIHERLRIGDHIEVAAPRNHFELVPASHYLFLAGGIGITPIAAMLDELHTRDAVPDFRLVYGGRTLASMAFVDRVSAFGADRVTVLPQDQHGLPDLTAALRACTAGTHVYCCGPTAMLEAVQEIASRFPDLELHVERFTADAAPLTPRPTDGSFEVELARSGVTVTVGPDRSVLDAVLEVVSDAPYSCTSGFCGSCEATVLRGAVDHRDELLTEAEQLANRTMMICVSRSRDNAKLVLDL